MKKHLALLLVFIMAVSVMSVAGVVTTTEKTDAQPSSYAVTVGPAGSFRYWPGYAANHHECTFIPNGGLNTADHAETSTRDYGNAKVYSNPASAKMSGESIAKVSIFYHLTGIGNNWPSISQRQARLLGEILIDCGVASPNVHNAGVVATTYMFLNGHSLAYYSLDGSYGGTGGGDKSVTHSEPHHPIASDLFPVAWLAPHAGQSPPNYDGSIDLEMISGVSQAAASAPGAGVQQAYGGMILRYCDIVWQ